MPECPIAPPSAPIDPTLAETAIDLQAIADDIERGLLAAVAEERSHMVAVVSPQIIKPARRTFILSFMGLALGGIVATLQRSAQTVSPDDVQIVAVSGEEEQGDAGCCTDRSPAVPEEMFRAQQAIAAGDAIALHAEDGACIAHVGKYSINREWILLGDAVNGVLLCPDEGLYIRMVEGVCVRGTRSAVLADPVTAHFLHSLPAVTSGGKTPASWGRDTSYGGSRGVARVQRLISQLLSEARHPASR
jgi:hypothetical protein